MRDHGDRLRLVLATPLDEALCRLVEELEPRVDLVREHDLLPPMRSPGDHGGDPSWGRTDDQQSRFEELVDSAQALYGIPDLSSTALARTVRANPQLRWVQTMAAGGASQVAAARLDPDDLERVRFTTSAGVHAGTLAEFSLFGLLAGAKTLPRLIAQQQRRSWSERWEMGQLHEQTVLVVGLGSIGRQTARLLAGLGARVIGANRSQVEVEGVQRVVGLEELAHVAAEVDAVVVTLPGADSTTGLLGSGFFTALRPGATIVNVGRGTVIDEAALVAALLEGTVGFAALDVTAIEPLPQDSPLWAMPNVLISPHTAALSPSEDRRIAVLAAENARRLLDGEPLRNLVRPQDLG